MIVFRNSLITALACAALATAAQAQEPAGPPPEQRRVQQRRPGPVFQNRARIFYEVWTDQEDPMREKSHGFSQFGQEAPNTDAEFFGRYHYKNKPELTSQLDLSTTFTNQTMTFGTSFGQVNTILNQIAISIPPNTKPTTPATKPAIFERDFGNEDSDTVFSTGADLSYRIEDDVTSWGGPLSWLPEPTALSAYARIGVGSFEVLGVDSDYQQLSFGPRLTFPFIDADVFTIDFSLDAGPAFLWTDIGDAIGFEASVGLPISIPISGNLHFLAVPTFSLYSSENVYSYGPGLHFGLGLKW